MRATIATAAMAGCLAAGIPAGLLAAAPAPASQTIAVAGLAAPASIVVDTWGVPHLYAASTDDVFFVQGFNAARDRLFQIDLWRRRGLGRLAAVFGGHFVEQDRAARLFLYRGDMAREWKAYGPTAERTATRFVAGINAYLDLVAREPARLPFEFAHFGYTPETWQPEDVVRIRSHGLTRNATSEFARAALACRGELAADAVRQTLWPPVQLRLPDGLDPCLPPEAMRTYRLGTQGVVVTGRDLRRSAAEPADPADPGATTVGALRVALADAPWPLEGSNAWAVAPSRTATGRPLLASDPHRALSVPSLRYIVHLHAPGLNVIGGGEPALPGVSIGHNGHIAFGLTIFAADQEDLVVHDTHPDQPGLYRHQGRWEAMTVLREHIAVRGAAPVPVELRFTRDGPVLHADGASRRAVALRAAWAQPGTAPYFGSIGYMAARNFKEFRRVMANWGAPSVNQVYADAAGNIGWVAGGLAPRRPQGDGLLPVPGDGRFDWAGFWPGGQMPWVLNPAAGWVASANEHNLPPADAALRERKLGFEWASPSRWQRIAEVLQSTPRMRVDDAVALQGDLVSGTARRLQAVLRSAGIDGAAAQPLPARPAFPSLHPTGAHAAQAAQAARMLLAWDARAGGDAPAAALFEVWLARHLGPAVKDALVPRRAALLLRTADTEHLLEALERDGPPLGSAAPARRNDVLVATLAAAWAEMQQLGGPDPGAWRWDRLHQVLLQHPLAAATDEATRARLNVGPLPKQGNGDTVNLSAHDPASFRQVGGASLRIVIDVGAWDNTRAVNTPGQSGDPASPHYRDLAPLWLQGGTFPLLYTRERVEAAAVQRIVLLPAGARARARSKAPHTGPGTAPATASAR